MHIESKNESPLKSFLAASRLRRTERDGGIQIQCGRGGWTTIEVKCKVPQRTFEGDHTGAPYGVRPVRPWSYLGFAK